MHSLAYQQKVEQRDRSLNDENSATWRAKAIEVGRQLEKQLGKKEYYALVDLMPNGKTWKFYHDFLQAALNDDDEKAYGWGERDWIGIQ